VTGYTVVAERLNFYRFISHFRSVHRGAFFAELKTTTVRKLMPDSWGFLCPVHTPDGAPCGLLNHLTHQARIVMKPDNYQTGSPVPVANDSDLVYLLFALGMRAPGDDILPVLLNGRLVGSVTAKRAPAIVTALRLHKAIPQLHQQLGVPLQNAATKAILDGHRDKTCTSTVFAANDDILPNMAVPWHLEVAFIEPSSEAEDTAGPFPGLFLATTPARLMRPVLQEPSNAIEWIGIFEQVFIPIAISLQKKSLEDTYPLCHRELTETNMLSVM
jgi:DNA-directed RNA polymerase I subunit RPA2